MTMIRVPDEELRRVIAIAIATAPRYVIRELFIGKALNGRVTDDTLIQRVFQAIACYEIRREATEAELAPTMTPLFPPTEEDLGYYSLASEKERAQKRHDDAERARIRKLFED